jgi:hypothetical protein
MREPPVRGTLDHLKAYLTMPVLRAAVYRIASAEASVIWHLYGIREPGRGGRFIRDVRIQRSNSKVTRSHLIEQARERFDVTEIVEHPMLDLLYNANDFMIGSNLRMLTGAHIELAGESFWFLQFMPVQIGSRTFEVPTQAWPVPPNWVSDVPRAGKPKFEITHDGISEPVEASQMIWFRDPNPVNPYGRGSGFTMALSRDLDIEQFGADTQIRRFYNRGRPDLLISGPGLGGPENTKTLERKMRRKVGGFMDAFKAFFLGAEVEVHHLSESLADLQLLELRKDERDAVLQTFGISPEILGILSNSNRATIAEAERIFARYVLEPRLEVIRETLQERLAPLYDDRLIVDYESPVPQDKEHQLNAMKAAPWTADGNEWRKVQGLPPDDSLAGIRMVPINLTPARSLEPEPPADPMPPALPAPNDPAPADGGGGPAVDEGKGASRAAKDETVPVSGLWLSISGMNVDVYLETEGAWRWPIHEEVVLEEGGIGPVSHIVEPAGILGAPALRGKVHPLKTGREPWKSCGHVDLGLCTRCKLEVLTADAHEWATKQGDAEDLLVHRVVDRLEPSTRQAFIRAMMEVQLETDLERLRAMLIQQNVLGAEEVVPWKALEARLRDFEEAHIRPGHLAVADGAADNLNDQLGITLRFDRTNPRAVQWASSNAARLVTEVAEQTKLAIRETIVDSFRNQITADETARNLRSMIGIHSRQAATLRKFRLSLVEQGITGEALETRVAKVAAAMLRKRATLIARTELITSSNMGQQLLWEQGIQKNLIDDDRARKIWITTPDDRLDFLVCEPMPTMPENQDLHVNEEFTTGEAEKILQPTAHPDCRCTTGLVFK